MAATEQYNDVQMWQLQVEKPFSRTACPKPALVVYEPAGVGPPAGVGFGSSAFPAPKDFWLDTHSSTTPHYAMKFYVRNCWTGGPNTGFSLRIRPKLWLKFRETH